MTSQPGFFERLRRPRTSNAGRDDPHVSPRVGGSERGVVSSTDDVTTRATSRGNGASSAGGNNGASRLSLMARASSGIPRSSSSSQVHQLPPRDVGAAEASSGRGTPQRSSRAHTATRSQGNIQFPGTEADGGRSEQGFPAMSRSGSSQSNAGGSSGGVVGLGRMLRRYSQGPGRSSSNANDAARAAAVSPSQRIATPTRTAASNGDASMRRQSEDGRRSRDMARIPASTTLTDITASSDSVPVHGHAAGATSTLSASGARGGIGSSMAPQRESSAAGGAQATQAGESSSGESQQPPVHRIRLVPNLEATRSLHFEPVERDIIEGSGPVKIGRFTDRGQQSTTGASVVLDTLTQQASSLAIEAGEAAPGVANGQSPANASRRQGVPGARGGAIPSSAGGAGRVDSARIAFKSKVVSRGHAEIWCEAGGKFYIKDTKSSSGTFLNHIRLSSPNADSRPHQLKDGDVVQLGVDYQGGLEEIYRCVKMRVELNRGWQRGANEYNINALRQLEALRGNSLPQVPTLSSAPAANVPALPTNREALSVTDCCICLYSVSVCQALFIAPCSHVYHYKCIRPLINRHFPGFQCPLCRTFADLEAEVERDDAWQEELLRAEIASRADASRAALDAITPREEIETMSFGTAARQTSRAERSQPANSSGERPAEPQPQVVTTTSTTASNVLTRHQADATLISEGRSRQGSASYRPSPPRVSPKRTPSSDAPRSNPIAIGANNTASASGTPQTQRFALDAFNMSPNFNDAGTPQNEHFLSTLAEAPPPPPQSAARVLSVETEGAQRASLGDVYSTPAQGNSPMDTSTMDAVMTARGVKATSMRASPGLAAVVPSDGKGKAPQTVYDSSLNGLADGAPGRSVDGRSPVTPSIDADKHASLRSNHSGRGASDDDDDESSRGTHRTNGDESNSSSGAGSHNDTRSGSGSAVLPAHASQGMAASDGVHAPSSPGSSGKLARLFKRPGSALQP